MLNISQMVRDTDIVSVGLAHALLNSVISNDLSDLE